MRLLLDTHAFIWHREGDARIGLELRRVVGDPRNDVFLSLASVWEMSIKQGLGKLGLKASVQSTVEDGVKNGFRLLPITLPHALAVQDLPPHHGDPFDRLLIAQTQIEGLTLVSRDTAFDAYGVVRLW